MNVNTNYYPHIDKTKQSSRIRNEQCSCCEHQDKKNRVDTFERSTPEQNIRSDHQKYVYGSPQYASAMYAAQAAYASLYVREPETTNHVEKEEKPYRVENTEKSKHSHNDESHSYNQQESESGQEKRHKNKDSD